MDIKLIFSILEKGLSLASDKEARKYLEQVIKLKREWHEEFNRKDRSQLSLDRIERELRVLAETFVNIPR
jgi:hypothetical protein